MVRNRDMGTGVCKGLGCGVVCGTGWWNIVTPHSMLCGTGVCDMQYRGCGIQ